MYNLLEILNNCSTSLEPFLPQTDLTTLSIINQKDFFYHKQLFTEVPSQELFESKKIFNFIKQQNRIRNKLVILHLAGYNIIDEKVSTEKNFMEAINNFNDNNDKINFQGKLFINRFKENLQNITS